MVGKSAEAGIGTLILFIAMILVSTIAAGVLVRTATSLQSKALETGKRTQQHIATAMESLMITAVDGSDANLENITHTIKLSPGSEGIKFNDTTISIEMSDVSANLQYNGTVTDCEGFTQNQTYTVVYDNNGTNHQEHYLQRGDLVKLCYALPRSIQEDELIHIAITPKLGQVLAHDLAIPDIITQQNIIIYP